MHQKKIEERNSRNHERKAASHYASIETNVCEKVMELRKQKQAFPKMAVCYKELEAKAAFSAQKQR
jgi:hypothetical protein